MANNALVTTGKKPVITRLTQGPQAACFPERCKARSAAFPDNSAI